MWSGIGFTFLIVVVTYQLYFLVAGFWNMVSISGTGILNFKSRIPINLTNLGDTAINGITSVGALKCGLANAIAFAAIQGRAGMLEAVVISFFGTIFYELNRQIVLKYSYDDGGSMTLFCFGGLFGSILSFMLSCSRQKKTVFEHQLRVSGKFSMTVASIGGLFCWVFFPSLNMEFLSSSLYQFFGGTNTIYCISSCVLTALGLSCIVYGRLDMKDLVYSPVIGGVIIGSSARLINNSAGAMLLGVGAAVINLLFRWVEFKLKWVFLT